MKIKKTILGSIAIIAAILLLKYDTAAADSALSAMNICIKRVIPSLFPYMVLSSFILSLDLAEPFYRHIPMSIFRLPKCTAPVFLSGLLCGFPVGAVGCASLYENGRITKNEASRLCAIASHTSPAFLIGTVGTLWGSKKFGMILYLSSLIFAVFTGIVLRYWKIENHSSLIGSAAFPLPKAVPAFCKAVTDAASSCLTVTGFIVFFRVAGNIASSVFPMLSDIFMVSFEFSSGVISGAGTGGLYGVALTGFAVGFSGFSVFMQIQKYLSEFDIPFYPIFFTKLLEGFFLAATSVIYYHLSPMQPLEDVLSSENIITPSTLSITIFVLVLLHFAGYFLMRKNKYVRRS